MSAPPPEESGTFKSKAFNTPALAATVALALLYAALRLWRLTDSCLWFDEIFGVHAARHGWGAMLRFLAADLVHPPLFYALLKLWVALGGESPAWLRLLPALASAAAIAPLLLLCRELRLRPAETNLALLLFALNGYLIKYAQEVRMYSLLLLLTLCSLWLFARFAASGRGAAGRRLAALACVNLLLTYTHYFGWLVLLTQLSFLFARASRRRLFAFAASVAFVALCFLPWAYVVARVAAAQGPGLAQNLGWMPRPNLAMLAQTFFTLNELLYHRQSSGEAPTSRATAALAALVFGLPLLLLLWRAQRGRRAEDGPPDFSAVAFLLWFFLLPVAAAFALSHLLPHSIWGARHLIVAAGPYLLLAGVALARLRPAWLKVAALALLGCWAFAALSLLLLRPKPDYIWCAWETLARRAAEDERRAPAAGNPRVKIYAFEEAVAYQLWFALSSAGEDGFTVEAVKGVAGVGEDLAYFLPRGFDEVKRRDVNAAFGEDRFWVAFRDRAWKPDRPPLSLLFERGHRVGAGFQQEAGGVTAFLVPVRRE